MNNALKDLLTEYVDDVRPYDVRAKALAGGKRRRVAVRIAPVVVILTLLAVAGLVSRSRLVDGVGVGTPALPPTISLNGFPAAIVPQPDAPPLPTDRAVQGVLVYLSDLYANRQATYLAAADGSQYRLDDAALPSPGSYYNLSPDRRWLMAVAVDQDSVTVTLRDLSMANSVARTFTGSPSFSPDGRWLVLGRLNPRNPGSVQMVDLQGAAFAGEPRTVDLSAFPGMQVASVLANGDLVLTRIGGGNLLDLSIVDPQTAAEKRRIHVDLAAFLTPSEQAGKAQMDQLDGLSDTGPYLLFTADGLAYYQTTETYGPPGQMGTRHLPKDVLVIDLASQRVHERLVLPEPKPSSGEPDQSESWRLLQVRPEGLLLQHGTTQHSLAWELYKPETRQLFLVTDLTALPGK